MCSILTTWEGAEITSCGEARAYGLVIPDEVCTADNDCLCNANLEAVFKRSNCGEWRWAPFGFDQVGPDGRTWEDGYDIETQDPDFANVIQMSRSDGRQPLTIDVVLGEIAAREV